MPADGRPVRVELPQTVYAVAMLADPKEPGGKPEMLVEAFGVSGVKPLTLSEIVNRAVMRAGIGCRLRSVTYTHVILK